VMRIFHVLRQIKVPDNHNATCMIPLQCSLVPIVLNIPAVVHSTYPKPSNRLCFVESVRSSLHTYILVIERYWGVCWSMTAIEAGNKSSIVS